MTTWDIVQYRIQEGVEGQEVRRGEDASHLSDTRGTRSTRSEYQECVRSTVHTRGMKEG